MRSSLSPQEKPNRYRFHVLEASGSDDDKPLRDLLCYNCKERHYLIERKTDRNNLFCTMCGALTPIRSVRRERGLAAPSIQNEATAIAQPKQQKPGQRRPHSLTEKHGNPLAEALEAKGFQIIDSQYNVPDAERTNM